MIGCVGLGGVSLILAASNDENNIAGGNVHVVFDKGGRR